MNLNNKETFFTLEGECDKKNRLLRSDAHLTELEAARIDSGELSLEDLDALVARKAKIFRYQTQITVHAQFPREVGGRVNGYAFLTNNKNGSVGVRYGAIDEAKRQRLARFLKYEGFRYEKNSTKHEFCLWKSFRNKDEAVGYLAEIKSLYDYEALRKLVYGQINIYGGAYWGMYYVALSITVNAIPGANIPEFLRLMRCKSEEEVTAIERQKQLADEADSERRRRENEEHRARENAEMEVLRKERLASMREKHTPVAEIPSRGEYSYCIVAAGGALVVLKRLLQKNGMMITRQFWQREDRYGSKSQDYQRWNMLVPPASCKDTARLTGAQINGYLAEGAVFSL